MQVGDPSARWIHALDQAACPQPLPAPLHGSPRPFPPSLPGVGRLGNEAALTRAQPNCSRTKSCLAPELPVAIPGHLGPWMVEEMDV